MSRAVLLAAFSGLLPQPAGAQTLLGAPAPDLGAGWLGFVVALAVAYLAERRSRRRS